MEKKQISFQVYTARNFKPYEDIFNFLYKTGFENIELFEVEAFKETKDLLDKYNLTAKSSHIGFNTLKNTEEVISRLKFLNVKHAIVPCPAHIPGKKFQAIFDKSEEEWNYFGKQLSSYVKNFEDHGLTLGYHNHAFEFNKLPSGKMPIECVLDHNEKLKFEIDIGWTLAGNSDPLIWIKKYSEKIIACHLKDFYSVDIDFQDHNQQSSVGEGIIDWPLILSEIKKTNCEIIAIEHDDPKDYKEYTKKSINYLASI